MNPYEGTGSDIIGRFRESFEGRRILVTGADGFMGSHLSETLLECGADVGIVVRGSARLGSGTWDFRCLETPAHAFHTVIACDIASPDLRTKISDFKPEIIFHLAAVAYVNYSFDHPDEVFRVNAVGTLNLLEAARSLEGLERLIVTSSSEVYGPALSEAISEQHPLNPTSPYAASKLAADRLAYSYRMTYGMPIVIVRPFNTYGPRHTYDVIPKFLRLALSGNPLTIYGDGLQERDFSYVADTIQGFLLAGSHQAAKGGVFNFGTGRSISIRKLAEAIRDLFEGAIPIVHTESRAAEVARLRADISRAKNMLGFQPVISLEEGLRRNVEWMKSRIA